MIYEKTISIEEYITKTYSKNQENCNYDYGCVLCGKATKSDKYFVVCSMSQHNVYTKKDVLELGYSFIEKNDGGFMYNYPIGNDCYRKYVKGNEVLENVVFKQGEL